MQVQGIRRDLFEERTSADDGPRRILVVDDTVTYRKAVSDALAGLPGVEVVGQANNGKIAMAKTARLKPDLLILDIEMPEMDGLEVLSRMRSEFPDVAAIILSTLTYEGGEITIKALELGAFDFITKPQSTSMQENRETLRAALAAKLEAFARYREIREKLRRRWGVGTGEDTTAYDAVVSRPHAGPAPRPAMRSEIVGIGLSTGGPVALSKVMPKLPADLGVPVLIAQHMPPVFTKSLAQNLDAKCNIEVREAVDGEALMPNVALIAPGGKQMKVVASADGKKRIIRVTDDPPENSCKPSVDYLFRSIARHYVGRATGVIMTGMGSDGAAGLKLMKGTGSTVIAQSPETCVVFGMPKRPIQDGIVDVIAPLDNIAEEIAKTVRRRDDNNNA